MREKSPIPRFSPRSAGNGQQDSGRANGNPVSWGVYNGLPEVDRSGKMPYK
jgi:hypothetical protein